MLSRYRNLAVLVVVLGAQLVLLAYQVRSHEDVTLLRTWTVTAVAPMARALEVLRSGTFGVAEKYFLLVDVQQRNGALKGELDRMKLENQFLRTQLETADRAKALAAFQQNSRSRTAAARIIGTGTGANSKVLFLDVGLNAGVQRGMAVITPDGIVGKITFVYPAASQVLLITDSSFAAGVISQKNRVRGTLKGRDRSQVIVDYVQNEVKVEEGEWFFTSGDDRVFPKGLPVGQAKTVKPGKTFKEIYLDPSGLQSGLEEVLIVLEGVHGEIPDAATAATGPVYVLPPPPDGSKSPGEANASGLNTDADRIHERIKKIGELQGVKFGTAGARLPNFNMDPAQVTHPVTPPVAPPAAAPEKPVEKPEPKPVEKQQ